MFLKAFEIDDGIVDCFLFAHGNVPSYLKEYLPVLVSSRYNNRNSLLRCFVCHTNCFNNKKFPYCVNEWNKLDPVFHEFESISSFKKSLLMFYSPESNASIWINGPSRLKITDSRLRVNFSHLREHKSS